MGLAAAAYNAGPDRVREWLAGRSTLPWETVDYVQFITGRPVEDWKEADTVLPKLLEDGQSLQEWCHALPLQKRIYHPIHQSQQATGPRRPPPLKIQRTAGAFSSRRISILMRH